LTTALSFIFKKIKKIKNKKACRHVVHCEQLGIRDQSGKRHEETIYRHSTVGQHDVKGTKVPDLD